MGIFITSSTAVVWPSVNARAAFCPKCLLAQRCTLACLHTGCHVTIAVTKVDAIAPRLTDRAALYAEHATGTACH